jgi:glucan biosynthesis protein
MAAVEKIPDTPQFRWYHMPTDNGLANIKVVWLPNVDGHPGSHFQVRYRYVFYMAEKKCV